MRNNIPQKLLIFSLIVLVGNAILGYAVYKSNQKLNDSERWVHRTEQVIYQSDNVLSIARDIESMSRAFVITGDTAILDHLHPDEKTILVSIRQLRKLTLDNPAQQHRIDTLDFYIHGLVNFSVETIELRSRQGLGPTIAYMSPKRSKRYTDKVSKIVTAIQDEENALLKVRKETNRRSAGAFELFSAIVFITMVGFTIVMLILLGKYLRKNKEIADQAAKLAAANNERTKMFNDLMLRNIDLEQFAYIISHNLRAPIANIIGASSVLNDPELSMEDKETLISGINVSVTGLDSIVKDLNHILQLKGYLNETKEIVNFSTLVDDIKFSIKNLIDKYNIEIKYDFAQINELFTLRAYLYSIFYNLISNSIKYRRQEVDCIIEIKSRLLKDKLELTFKDNGTGIDLKKSGELLFGLYKRFHNSAEGKGFGLFMVKTQVEKLGGKISVKSKENEGAEFTVEFEV